MIFATMMSKSQQIVNRVVKMLLISAVTLVLFTGMNALNTASATCLGADFKQAERLIRTALKARVLKLIKGSSVFTVAVKRAWWSSHGDVDRRALVVALNCAVAGEGKTLARLRLVDMTGGAVLFDGKP